MKRLCLIDYHMMMFAHDVFLIAPSSYSLSVLSLTAELLHLSSWASSNNLLLNPSKTHELIIVPKEMRRGTFLPPPTLPNVERVTSMKLLGVILQDNLSMDPHVSAVVSKGAQSLFALNTLKAH